MTKEKLLSMKVIAEKELALGIEDNWMRISPSLALEMIEICLAQKEREETYRKGVLGLSNPGTIADRKEDIPK